MLDPALAGLGMQIASSGVSQFQNMLPKLADIRKATVQGDPDMAADVRLGEIAAVTLTVGFGLVASAFTKNPTPAILAGLVALSLVFLYESTLRGDPTKFAPKGI
jgi:hypothetical protein